ncbi:MAG: hypothetical protein COB22_02965 [Cycloclasticus sp.]|nr:MAG: hypothetical protein COB22_02965 [Cycloclasticus sp.]
MELVKKTALLCIIFFIASCAVVPEVHIPKGDPDAKKKLVVFMDGTANAENSYTNVSKLRNLVTLQNRSDIRTTYIAGVGTGMRVLGMAAGFGMANDIRQAYDFLTVNYKTNQDKIYLFGFSRGAYAVRALSGLIQVAGIPDLSELTINQRKKRIDGLFKAYRYGVGAQIKSERVEKWRHNNKTQLVENRQGQAIEIEFVGIWDTVSALGIPVSWGWVKKSVDIFVDLLPNGQSSYLIALCNVKRISHALSLDDDRADIFTPVFVPEEPDESCTVGERIINRKINQVFFSGAHADVGGGYPDTDIDGVSLNWMLSEIVDEDLLPEATAVYADPYGQTHDPESGGWSLLYHFEHRDFSDPEVVKLLGSTLKVHPAVIDRLERVPNKCHETQWETFKRFKSCFEGKTGWRNNGQVCDAGKDGCEKVEIGGIVLKAPLPKDCELKVIVDDSYTTPERNAIPYASKLVRRIAFDPQVNGMRTGIKLVKGGNYRFVISDVIGWRDGVDEAEDKTGSCATPEVGRRISRSDGNWITSKFPQYMGKLSGYKLTSGYMELLGEVNGETIQIGRLAREERIFSLRDDNSSSINRNKVTYKRPNRGEDYELILRVNEPRIPPLKGYYTNNRGSLVLEVYKVN